MIHFSWRAAARRMAAPASTVLTAMVILSACGGGGGDGTGSGSTGNGGTGTGRGTSTPPAPTLSITPSATTTTSSGTTVALHAAQTHSTSTPAWTLSGPGSLSASTGADVTYTPPDAESFTQAGTATVSVAADGLSSQVVISVGVGSLAGQHWSTTQAASPSWNAVAFASNTFVAVGSSGGLATSTDGQHWTWRQTPFHDWRTLAHGDAGWVAVSSDGWVATSADGLEWTTASAALPGADSSNTFVTQVVFGNGVYVVASEESGSWISTDGVSWTATPNSFYWLASGGGTLVGYDINSQNTFASSDGVNWSQVYVPYGVASAAYANGMFLGNSGSELVGSTDGRNWNIVGSTLYFDQPMLSSGAAFYQSQSDFDNLTYNGVAYQTGAISMSTTGQQWTYRNQTAVGVASGIAQGTGAIVVVSQDGSIGSGPDVDHLQAAVPPSIGMLASADYVNGKYMVPTSSGKLLTSTDGQAWSTRAIAPAAWAGQSINFVGGPIAHSASGRIVLVGATYSSVPSSGTQVPAALYSDDGITWNVASVPADANFMDSVFYDGQKFLAFSASDAYVSSDGSAWTDVATVAQYPQWINHAAYGNGRYVLIGNRGLAASSVDAVHWTVAPTVMDHGQTPAPVDFASVVYAGNRFVAVGSNGNVATSTDGLSWSVATSATTQSLYLIAVSPQGEMVAVGPGGALETSIDAAHWTLRNSDGGSLTDLVFVNGSFMAVGYDGFIEMSSH